jgi:hypothetical protein
VGGGAIGEQRVFDVLRGDDQASGATIDRVRRVVADLAQQQGVAVVATSSTSNEGIGVAQGHVDTAAAIATRLTGVLSALPEAEAAALQERRKSRDAWVLLAVLLTIAVIVAIGQVL